MRISGDSVTRRHQVAIARQTLRASDATTGMTEDEARSILAQAEALRREGKDPAACAWVAEHR